MIAKKLKSKIKTAVKAGPKAGPKAPPGMSKPLPPTAVKPMAKLQGLMQRSPKATQRLQSGLRKKMY